MNALGFRPPLYIGKTGRREPPENGEITLPSKHRIRNSIPGCLRPITLPFGHEGSLQYWIFSNERVINFCFFKPKCQSGVRTRYPRFPRQAALTTAPGFPPMSQDMNVNTRHICNQDWASRNSTSHVYWICDTSTDGSSTSVRYYKGKWQ